MQIWKWKSTPASVLLCIVRSTYAAVSRPTISSSSVSSLRWQRNIALFEPVWFAGPIIFSVCCLCGTELCRGGGCLRDTFPLRWQWGQCNDNVGDSTPTTSTMGTLWNNSGISFKVFWFSRLPLATTPKLMVTFVYQTGCPKITPFCGFSTPGARKDHETMSICAEQSKLLLNIAKGTTDPGVDCFNKMKNLTNNATYSRAKQPL